nr:MAG TPA: hypothetical protein [Caudoviricetes sp.]
MHNICLIIKHVLYLQCEITILTNRRTRSQYKSQRYG